MITKWKKSDNYIKKKVLGLILTIQQFAMINCHPSYPANKLEVREVIFITQSRVGIYL